MGSTNSGNIRAIFNGKRGWHSTKNYTNINKAIKELKKIDPNKTRFWYFSSAEEIANYINKG